jgi:3D (Asp-Asp-Asp) domain-containing protein
MGLTGLFTYMRVSYDYEVKMRETEAQLLLDVHNYAAQVAGLRGEIRGYREVITSLSRPGKRIPLGRFRVTAYDPDESCKPFNDNYTSTGLKIVDDDGKIMRGVVAVDPGKIPYGSTIYLRELNLLAYAADTGAAMKKRNGKNIDILVPTVAEAMEFGVQYVDVDLIDVGN